MNAFIAPLYVQTNPLSLEKIVFGLLAVSDRAVFLHVSKHKLQVAEQLLSTSLTKFINASLSPLRQKVAEYNKEVKDAEKTLFAPGPNVFNQQYIYSLSQYSRGLIQFGEPLAVAGELTRPLFAELYEKFIGEPMTPVLNDRTAFARRVKTALNIPNLANKADIHYSLKPSKVAGLLKPTTITLLTAHNALLVFQQIDFSNTETVIANNLYEFEAVADVLNEYSKREFKKPGEFTIIADEPVARTPQHHQYDTVKRFKREFGLISTAQLAKEALAIASNGHGKASVYLETEKTTDTAIHPLHLL